MIREAPTKAQQLIDGASFGPEALKAIGTAFDAAWAEVVGNFGNDPARRGESTPSVGQLPFCRLPARIAGTLRF